MVSDKSGELEKYARQLRVGNPMRDPAAKLRDSQCGITNENPQ